MTLICPEACQFTDKKGTIVTVLMAAGAAKKGLAGAGIRQPNALVL